MFRKDEKKALTRIALLTVGWGVGLDRFYEGKVRDGFLSIIGWGLIFTSLMLLSPCHGYGDAGKTMTEMSLNPLIVAPLGLGGYGVILVLRKAFRLLRQFETAED